MIKLFAIFTVLSALPVSALAYQESSNQVNPLAFHCTKDDADVYAQTDVAPTNAPGNSGDAVSANTFQKQRN